MPSPGNERSAGGLRRDSAPEEKSVSSGVVVELDRSIRDCRGQCDRRAVDLSEPGAVCFHHEKVPDRLLAQLLIRAKDEICRLSAPGGFTKNVSILAGGTAASQALAVCLTPLLTRLYLVEDFGYFQLYLSFMAFATLTATLRYEQAILLPEEEHTALNLVVVTFCAVVLSSGLFGLLAWRLHQSAWLPRSAAPLGPFWWVVVLGVFGAGVYQTLNFWALRQTAYKRVAGTKFTQVFLQLTTQMGLGLSHVGPFGLLFGDAVGRMGGSLSLTQLLWSRCREALRAISWKTLRNAAARYWRFPLISCGSAVINTAGYALPAVLIAQFYGAKTLGWYALGDRVLGAPVMLVGQAVSQVYAVEVANFSNTNPTELQALFLGSIKRLALLGLVPLFLFLFLSPLLFGFVFGHGWREAGVYASLLSFSYYFAFIVWPLMPTLNLLEEQFWQLSWDIGRLILTLGSLLLAYRFGWSARGAVGLFSAAMIVGYLVHLFLSRQAIQRKIQRISALRETAITASPTVANLGEL